MKKTSKMTAILSGAVLVGAAGLAVSVPALAAPGDGGTGSLTVHKFEQPGSGDFGPADGTQITPPQGALPVGDVGFTVCSVTGIDLAVPSDWDRLKDLVGTVDNNGDLVVTEGGSPVAVSCQAEVRTDVDGEAAFASLPADRAYFVYESTPADNSLYAMIPTLVTVPFPGNGTGAAWNYDVHIYPKNALVGSGATKNGEIIGSDVTFDITVPINNLGLDDNGNQVLYTQFVITDQLSSALTYGSSSVQLLDSNGDEVTMTAGTDYTLAESAGLVTLTMVDPAGLALLDANIGGKLVLTITADANGTGDTSNTATITINGKGNDVSVVDPEEFYSGAYIMKEASNRGATANVPLAGAGFELYTKAGLTSCPAYDQLAADAEMKQVDLGSNYVSGTDGKTPELVLAKGSYCVYETVVPAGYKGAIGGALLDVQAEGANLTVVNTQVGSDEGDLPSLPVTGAQGRVLLAIAGVGFLTIAMGLYLVRRNRQRETESQQ
ncbi:SpaH/EbpB family LPXTG-anchored major pilin [Scrofimicrobium sp. R131]|uniref:SpaH/EbpB family LPXTG-anchored major pilin n=1 Tax=Scrofimicrobium appendicitidis TaxID=3079930 RepID=A0AAU7V777_9ACTO